MYGLYHLLKKSHLVTILSNFPVVAFLAGCLNGGGQLRAEGEETAKELLGRVDQIYQALGNRCPHTAPHLDQLYTDWLGGPDTDEARAMLHTQYHEVEKMTNALVIKW